MPAYMKLAEARFFLELLDALENRKSSLTNDGSCGDEASYLLSAVLNALYSALEQTKPIVGVEAVQQYKSVHPSIFKGKGGLRNVTIHERHVGPDYSGYIPLLGNAVNFDFRPKPKLVKEAEAVRSPGRLDIVLGSNHYVNVDGTPKDITELCFEQYYALRSFFKTHNIVI